MTLFLKLKVKSLVTNKHLLFWSVFFVEFWLIMWFFVFSREGGEVPIEYVETNTATAFAFLGLIAAASVAISLTYSSAFQIAGARYVTKFTKLSPRRYAIEDFAANLVVFLIILAIFYISTMVITWIKYRVWVVPKYPLMLFGALVMGGILAHLLSYDLGLLVFAIRKPKSLTFIAMLPLMIAFVAYAALWTDFGVVATYVNPFHAYASIVCYTFLGKVPPIGRYFEYFFGGAEIELVDLRLALFSLMLWYIALLLGNVLLLRRVKVVSIHEIAHM